MQRATSSPRVTDQVSGVTAHRFSAWSTCYLVEETGYCLELAMQPNRQWLLAERPAYGQEYVVVAKGFHHGTLKAKAVELLRQQLA